MNDDLYKPESFRNQKIPKIFFSDLTNSPLEKCLTCDKRLLEENVEYLVEKALKTYDGLKSYSTIFEYAICMDCALNMRKKLSQKSMQSVQNYIHQNMDMERLRDLNQSQINFDLDARLSKCMVKDIDVRDIGECQIYAHCSGKNLSNLELPYMISGKALDELSMLLSTETQDEMDSFKDKLIDGPSEFEDLIKSGPVGIF